MLSALLLTASLATAPRLASGDCSVGSRFGGTRVVDDKGKSLKVLSDEELVAVKRAVPSKYRKRGLLGMQLSRERQGIWVSFGSVCGELCGHGFDLYLEKLDDAWTVLCVDEWES